MSTKSTVKIFVAVVLTFLLAWFLMATGGAFLVKGAGHLIGGWWFYLSETLPKVQIKWSGVATFVIAGFALLVLTHSFLSWLARHRSTTEKPLAWRWPWTIKGFLIILLAFAAGICATGVVHQVAWIVSSDVRMLEGGIRRAADKMLSASNMRQLMVAMHNYHNDHKELPPVFTVSKDAIQTPLLSWRVLILPYLEEEALYKKFKLDEPWNSPHNIEVMMKNPMPKVFRLPGQSEYEALPQDTNYRAFYSKPGAAKSAGLSFGSKMTLGLITSQDGTSNTAALVEGAPIYWTKPEDIEYAEAAPLPGFRGRWFNNTFQVAMFDASVRSIQADIPEADLKAIITRNGGEIIESKFIE